MYTYSESSIIKDRAISVPSKNQAGGLIWFLILTGIVLSSILILPAQAGDKYLAGSPDLSVSLSGPNEYLPNQDVRLAVVVRNTGFNEYKFAKSSIVDREDLPNTAKFLTVSLQPGDSPLIIKSDPQVLGDLKASSTATGTFTVRIPSGTPAGTYNLPVILNYTYLFDAYQYGTDSIQYNYKVKNETLTIPVKVKADVRPDVISKNIEYLNAGNEGYINLVVKNAGSETAKKAIVVIAQNGQSPVTPTQGTVYVGDFPPGATANCTFRATVSKNAEPQVYPLDVYVRYENHDGDTVSSEIETIGIPVGQKIDFTIIPDPKPIAPGEKKVITIQYKNTGGATAYKALARVSLVDPFTSNDDSAYIGDIAPGETKTASFLITADKTATPKEYGIDSEVKYRDALDNSVTSDPLKVTLTVAMGKGIGSALFENPVLLGLIALIIAAVAYLVYRKKKLQ